MLLLLGNLWQGLEIKLQNITRIIVESKTRLHESALFELARPDAHVHRVDLFHVRRREREAPYRAQEAVLLGEASQRVVRGVHSG